MDTPKKKKKKEKKRKKKKKKKEMRYFLTVPKTQKLTTLQTQHLCTSLVVYRTFQKKKNGHITNGLFFG